MYVFDSHNGRLTCRKEKRNPQKEELPRLWHSRNDQEIIKIVVGPIQKHFSAYVKRISKEIARFVRYSISMANMLTKQKREKSLPLLSPQIILLIIYFLFLKPNNNNNNNSNNIYFYPLNHFNSNIYHPFLLYFFYQTTYISLYFFFFFLFSHLPTFLSSIPFPPSKHNVSHRYLTNNI